VLTEVQQIKGGGGLSRSMAACTLYRAKCSIKATPKLWQAVTKMIRGHTMPLVCPLPRLLCLHLLVSSSGAGCPSRIRLHRSDSQSTPVSHRVTPDRGQGQAWHCGGSQGERRTHLCCTSMVAHVAGRSCGAHHMIRMPLLQQPGNKPVLF
jgi:hypothetical protein